MYDSKLDRELAIPIRLENATGVGITGVTVGGITVKKADSADTTWQAVAGGSLSMNELGEGDYTLRIAKAVILKPGFFRAKVYEGSSVTKQYVSNILPTDFDIYFKSTGNDSTGNGTFEKPYQSIGQCLTHINARNGFTIHVLDDPANVAGNKDQDINAQVRIDGHGSGWAAITPVTYHIKCAIGIDNIIIENMNGFKIDYEPDAQGGKLFNCYDVSIVSGLFGNKSIYEKCSISNAITGGGTESGKDSTFRDITFLSTVNFSLSFDGAIFDNIRFRSDLTIGDPVQYCEFNNITVRGNLNLSNNALNGKNVFRNIHVDGNVTALSAKSNVFIGGAIRGNVNLDSGTTNHIFWQTRIKGTITDNGTGNEVLNKVAWAVPADKMDLLDTLKNKAGASGFDRTTDSLEAVGEKAQDVISKAKMKDIIFNRNVTQRHPAGPGEDKPKTIIIGVAGAEGTVTTTIDGDGNLETESIV